MASPAEIKIPPVRKDNTIPEDAVCQEASTLSHGTYIPCGRPATAIIKHAKESRAYYMCEMCADHNVRNRGGKLLASRERTLKERLKDALHSAAPSMVPQAAPTPPPAKQEEYVPSLSEIIQDRKERLALSRLIQQAGELGASIKSMENERKPLTEKIKRVVGTLGIPKAIAGDWRYTYYAQSRKSYKEDKIIQALLKRGMQPNVIQHVLDESAEVTNPLTLRITPVGEEE